MSQPLVPEQLSVQPRNVVVAAVASRWRCVPVANSCSHVPVAHVKSPDTMPVPLPPTFTTSFDMPGGFPEPEPEPEPEPTPAVPVQLAPTLSPTLSLEKRRPESHAESGNAHQVCPLTAATHLPPLARSQSVSELHGTFSNAGQAARPARNRKLS